MEHKEVKDRFKDGWSADQTAGILALETLEKQISHETSTGMCTGNLRRNRK